MLLGSLKDQNCVCNCTGDIAAVLFSH